MGKYQSGVRRQEYRSQGPHPIWRGIGCFLIVLVPLISFAAAELSMPFFRERGLVPRELLFTPQTPDWLWVAPVLAQAFQALFGRFGILAILVLTIIYIIIIGGIMTVLYAFMYQLTAPSRYGPMDAPPIRTKVKKYKR
jgi:hypothetical protein